MLGGVPRHPCGIYTPSIHSEQLFGVLGHCPTMITQLGVCQEKTHESRVFGTYKKTLLQVSELGNFEIPYFPYQNNNREILTKECKGVPRPVSPSSGGVLSYFFKPHLRC